MISIIIAEDQRLLRGAMAALLELEDDMEVAGEAGDGAEALALIERLQPDVCLMDIEMPLMSGLEVAELLKSRGSATKIIILTTFARPGYFERGVKAGIQGYLLKDEPVDKLAEAIRRVVNGGGRYRRSWSSAACARRIRCRSGSGRFCGSREPDGAPVRSPRRFTSLTAPSATTSPRSSASWR